MKRRIPLFSMYVLCALILAIMLIRCSEITAQTSDSTKLGTEATWIEKMNNEIGLDISFNNSFRIFEVQTPSTKFVLYPNTPNNLRLTVNYQFIMLAFQLSPDFLPGNRDRYTKGNTKSYEFETRIVLKHMFTNLSYSKVKGYYLQNSNDFTSWEPGNPYIQFPDLNYKGITLNSGYIHNSNFSLKSITTQTERQLRSAGSFIPVFNFNYYVIDDKSSEVGTQKSKNIEMNIGPGYIHTFVIKERFYLSVGSHASLGYLNTKLTTRMSEENMISRQENFILRWDGRSGFGFNGEKFYTGLYATVSGTEYKQENTTATNFETRVYYHLFLGIRLKSPDYLDRYFNKINQKRHH